MLQEGFADVVTSKTIKLRLVDKTQNGYSNETIVENGTVYLQVGLLVIEFSKSGLTPLCSDDHRPLVV